MLAKAVLHLVKCQIITVVVIKVFATNNKRGDEQNSYYYIVFMSILNVEERE